MRKLFIASLALASSALVLTGCGEEQAASAPEPPPAETMPKAVPKPAAAAKPDAGADDADEEVEAQPGTPLAERVATLGLLNKRNNKTINVEIKPGESKRIDDVVIRLSSCERTAPWEMPQETGAFAQVLVLDPSEDEWIRIFSGWLFKNSPSINVVEHPIYDVWVKDCAMSFPGDDEPTGDSGSGSSSSNVSDASESTEE